MLIIAIPKSASTSLLYTLGKELNFPAEQIFGKASSSNSFQYLAKLHSDIGNYDMDFFEKVLHPYKIFKQHIPPTENNVNLLRGSKKVVLLREVNDIILAYKRGANAEVHNLLKGFDKSWSDQKWLSLAKEAGLYTELEQFFNLWKKEEGLNTLIIDYNDLIKNPAIVVNQVLRFFEYPLQLKSVNLVKARYSRVSGLRKIFRKFRKKFNV